MERASLAIVSADIAGYTRLMESSEQETFERLKTLRDDLIRPALDRSSGNAVKWTGDGFLAVFPSDADPVRCAIDIQSALQTKESSRSRDRAILVRIGISFGNVLLNTNDVYGNEVNVAARLQEIAEPGQILISHAMYEQLPEPKRAMIDLGPQALRNLSRPVGAYRVLLESEIRYAGPTNRVTERPSIAVLPFRSRDPDPSLVNLGEGIAEEITAALTSLREVLVISHRSAQVLEEATSGARVSSDIGARYVLSGTVRKLGDRLRITAELADPATNTVLWANRYDLAPTDFFDVQDRITSTIVHTLAPEIQQAELRRIEHKRPESMTAYDHYVQGLRLMYRLRDDEFVRAGTLLRRAIALDDGYAAAFAATAEWHSIRVGQGWSPDPDADRLEAIRLAEAAIDRDRHNALALAALGHFNAFLHRQYDRALNLFDQALTTSPGHARAWAFSAPTFNYIGETEAAIGRARHALRLSPLDPLSFWPHTTLCIAHYINEDYAAAIEAAQASLAGNDRYTTTWHFLAAALAATRRYAEAGRAAAKILALQPGFRAAAHAAGYPCHDPAMRDRFHRHLLAAGLPD